MMKSATHESNKPSLKLVTTSGRRHSRQSAADSGPPSSASDGPTVPRRKYTRHPKTDPNAPIKPLSAYMRFTKAKRKEYVSRKWGFTQLTKQIGVEWQELAPEVKAIYNSEAKDERANYHNALKNYRKTSQFGEYKDYLDDFLKRNPNSQNVASPKSATQKNEASSSGDEDDEEETSYSQPSPLYSNAETADPPLGNIQLQQPSADLAINDSHLFQDSMTWAPTLDEPLYQNPMNTFWPTKEPTSNYFISGHAADADNSSTSNSGSGHAHLQQALSHAAEDHLQNMTPRFKGADGFCPTQTTDPFLPTLPSTSAAMYKSNLFQRRYARAFHPAGAGNPNSPPDQNTFLNAFEDGSDQFLSFDPINTY